MRAYAECSTPATRIPSKSGTRRGELAGGGYGVAVGGSFVTELQFSRESNTSKSAFTVLNWHWRIGALPSTTAS